MNQGRYVFAQLNSFLPQRVFDRIVEKYEGNYKVRHFTCWNQMMCMMFGQLSSRESLSDLVLGINAHKAKAYHLGFGIGVSKSNIAKANEKRDYRIYEDFAYQLISQAREKCVAETLFAMEIKGNVYAFDSSTIDLCLSVFWWAKFRKAKGAIKLHTLFDVKTGIPSFMYISNALSHDVHGMDQLIYEMGSYYIFDRGYVDFERLYTIEQSKAFFVVRAKDNLHFKRVYSSKCDKRTGVCSDQSGKLVGYYSAKDYPALIRRVRFYDAENKRYFVFLSNNFKQKPEEIALLYKHRWRVELFFKWIKQHLKIKSFWGTVPNAVKTQVYIAIITYTLVALIKHDLKTKLTCYEILQILNVSLLDKTPLNELLTNIYSQDVKELNCNQLSLF